MVALAAGALLLPAYGDEPGESSRGPEGAAPGDPVAVETYVAPKGIHLVKPRYPEEQAHRREEGWVALNFMVDTEGQPYEITVVNSVGDDRFRKAAIRALKRSRFEPARLDGQPIDAGARYGYSFEMSGGADGAGRDFVFRYRKLLAAIGAGDRDKADALLADLEPRNLYENAYRELGRYTYLRKWGTRAQQLGALSRAVGPDEERSYLADDARAKAMTTLFLLQADQHDFGGALETAGRLPEQAGDEDLQATIDQAVREIEALRHDDRAFAVEGRIGERSTSWHLKLLKSSFRFDGVEGRISEIKLRCAGKFVGFAYDDTLTYSVVERYMPCSLEVVGDPGTRFRLIQS